MVIDVIQSGIYNRLVGDSNDFRTAITLSTGKYKMFYEFVEREYFPGTTTKVTLPLVVYSLSPINYSRDSASEFPITNINFNVAGNTSIEAQEVAGYLVDRLENSEDSLSFTGYSVVFIKKESIIPLGRIDQVWNVSVRFLLELQK